jgi:hypothetical protein
MLHLQPGWKHGYCIIGTIDLAGTAANTQLRIYLVEAIVPLRDALHDAEHGAQAAAGAFDRVDGGQSPSLSAKGVGRIGHRNHLSFYLVHSIATLSLFGKEVLSGI